MSDHPATARFTGILRGAALALWRSPTWTTWGMFSSQALNIFLVLPLMLVRFDPAEVAAYLLFSSVIALCDSIQVAFSTSYVRLIAYAFGGSTTLDRATFREAPDLPATGPNWELLERVYACTITVHRVILLVLATVLAVGGSLALHKVLEATPDPSVAWAAWAAIATGGVTNAWRARDVAVLKGMDRVALVNRWEILLNGGRLLAVAVLLLLGGNLLAVTLPTSVMGLIGFFVSRRLVQTAVRSSPQRPGPGFDREILRQIWSPSWRQFVLILLGVGMVHASGLVLSQFRQGVELAAYLFALRLVTLCAEFSRAPFYSRIPDFSRLRASGTREELANQTGIAMRWCLVIYLATCCCVAVAVPPGMELVGSQTPFVGMGIWSLLTTVFLLERHHAMHVQIVMTTNRVPFVLPATVTGILDLLLMIGLGNRYGAAGIAAAHGLANLLIFTWWAPLISWRSLGRAWSLNLRGYLPHVLAAVVVTVAALASAPVVHSWLDSLLHRLR